MAFFQEARLDRFLCNAELWLEIPGDCEGFVHFQSK